jgi:hypothetical protein
MTVDISEKRLQQITIFPNPNSGSFYLNFPDQISGNALLQIYNVNGQMIYKENILMGNSGQVQLKPNNIEKGFYIVELQFGEQKWVKKLVVQ